MRRYPQVAPRHTIAALPRLPLDGKIDLTYRCNNTCRHCWLWEPDDETERARELDTGEWREVIDQARALGTCQWAVSGGEPMLREDFSEIFEYLTAKARGYSLNTNGTLITPDIAQLLRRKGSKMVAVYGATADVYQRVTRNPGGFEALLQGLAYLREAGAGFTIQLIPMRDNWHQWAEMLAFAQSWSRHYRVGAPWLFKSACGDAVRNAEIERQRLDPADVVALDTPSMAEQERLPAQRADGVAAESADRATAERAQEPPTDDRLYATCIAGRRDLHVDPYGGMSFCGFVKDPALRFDLRAGAPVADTEGAAPLAAVESAAPVVVAGAPVAAAAAGAQAAAARPRGIPADAVRTGWEEFIPSLADQVHGGREYLEGCAGCTLRRDCRWCDVYGYLEHRRHGAKVEHLCAVAREARDYREKWMQDNRRYYEIAGVTVQVDSDLPIADDTFDDKFVSFRVDGPGPDTVSIRQHFGLPERDGSEGAKEVYRKPPWAIYRTGGSSARGVQGSAGSSIGGASAGSRAGPDSTGGAWIYQGISPDAADPSLHRIAVFNADHTRGELYNDDTREKSWRDGGLSSLTMFPSDQILLARLLADREGCFLHSGALTIDGHGFVFVGHSDAGKSTTMLLVREALGERVEILCDDRNIVRFWTQGFAGGPPGFYVHGTWSHGDVPDVSSAGAPLRAILFLEQSPLNEIVPLTDRRVIWQRLLATLIKPMVTADWWHKEMDVLERIVNEVPCYTMRFDKSGAVVSQVERLTR